MTLGYWIQSLDAVVELITVQNAAAERTTSGEKTEDTGG
jgi:hypothetical protein